MVAMIRKAYELDDAMVPDDEVKALECAVEGKMCIYECVLAIHEKVSTAPLQRIPSL